MGHFYRTCVEGLVIWLEIVLKLVGNVLDFLRENLLEARFCPPPQQDD